MYKLLNAIIALLCAGILLQTLVFCARQSVSPPAQLDPFKPPERAGQRGVGNLWYDLIEDDPALKTQFEAAEGEATAEMERVGAKGEKGYGNRFDSAKQRILKEKYGIVWRTTHEMNPRAYFD